ncbi:MAG: hypothetical protein ACM32E_24065 [Gemmatimonadota bacterium]
MLVTLSCCPAAGVVMHGRAGAVRGPLPGGLSAVPSRWPVRGAVPVAGV